MATQTGSIDFKATGGFKSYAQGQYTTIEQFNTVGGRNLLRYDVKHVGWSSNAVYISNNVRGMYCAVEEGKTYTVSRRFIEGNRFGIYSVASEPIVHGLPATQLHADTSIDTLSETVTIPTGGNWLLIYLSNASENISDGNIKVELGSVATPWTMAPEDAVTRFASVQTAIEQNSETIALKANSSDVYTKTESDGLISTEVTNRNAAITESANAITLSVSQQYVTNQRFDDLKIGGRNFLPMTETSLTSRDGKTYTIQGITITQQEDGWFSVSGTRDPSVVGSSNGILSLWRNPTGDNYTAPINERIPAPNSERLYMSVEVEGTPFLAGTLYTNSSHVALYGDVAGKNVRCGGYSELRKPVEIDSPYVSTIRYYMGIDSSGTVNGRFRVKLETGDLATAWTPAPEDIDAHFGAVESSITQTADSITESVSKSYATKEESKIESSGSGKFVLIDGAASATIKNIHMIGESVQNGTPAPDAPIPIASVSPANLSPFFSHDFDDTSYWKTRHVNYSQLDDGWAHLDADRTSSTSNGTYYFAVEPLDGLVAGDTYTVLTEVRNLDSSVATTNNVFRSSYSARQLNATSNLSYATVTRDYAAYYQQVTVADPSAAELIRGRAYVYAGNSLSFDIRISVYKGAYKEPYVPCDSIGMFIRGKNLFGPRTTSVGTAGGVDWSIDEYGTCVMSGTATSASTFTPVANTYLPEGTYTLSASDGHEVQFDGVIGQYVTKTFDSKWNVSLAKVYVRNGTTYSGSFTVQLERGDTATEYEPYSGAITTIPLNGNELRSLPDGTQDELTVDVDGHVTMTQRVGCVTFNGSEEWSAIENEGARAVSPPITNLKFQSSNAETANMRSDRFTPFTPNNSWAGTSVGVCGNISIRRIYFSDGTKTMTLSAWVEWVSSNPTTVLFELETPQTIDLGTIDMPQVQDGNTVEVIAAVTPSIDATWWASAGQAVADAYANLSSAIEVRAESITSTVASNYATKAAVQEISTQIEQTATGWTAKFNQLTGGEDLSMTLAEAFESLGVTSANLEQIRSFVRITTDSSGDPLLLMGSATSPIMLALSNDSLEFRHGADRVAYIDVDSGTNEGMLHITRAVVVKELQFGSWKWFEREGNGNMALKWVGEEV